MKKIAFLFVFLIVSLVLPLYNLPKVKAQESEGWLNRYVYQLDLGNGTYTTRNYIGVQVFWNNQTEEWQKLLLVNRTDYVLPHYLIRNSHISARIGLYDGEDAVLYYDPDMTRKICAERWNIQAYQAGEWQTGTKTFYNHTVTQTENEINITGLFRVWFGSLQIGWLQIRYVLRSASFLKHEITYMSIIPQTRDYRVIMTLIGIAGKQLVHNQGTIILNQTEIEDVWNRLTFVNATNPNFQFLEEKLDSLGHYFLNETTGEEMWINDYLKAVRLKEVTYWGKQLVRCDIVIGNYTLMENETFFIDPDTSTWSINASDDDANVYQPSAVDTPELTWSTIQLSVDALRLSRHYATERWGCGLRYENVNLGSDATITSAYFGLYCYNDRSGSVTSRTYGQDDNSTSTFTSVGDFNGRDRTGNFTEWDFDGTINTWHTSPDIKSVIQEIVDNNGGATDIVLFPQCEEGGHDPADFDDLFNSYNRGSSFASNLTITWSTVQEDEKSFSLTADTEPGANVYEFKEKSFLETALFTIASSLAWGKEKLFYGTETFAFSTSLVLLQEMQFGLSTSVSVTTTIITGIETVSFFLTQMETVTINTETVFLKEMIWIYAENIETVATMTKALEKAVIIFVVSEIVIVTAQMQIIMEVIAAPVDVTTFGTVAFVIAIIALALSVTTLTVKKRL